MEFGWSQLQSEMYERVLSFARESLGGNQPGAKAPESFSRAAWDQLGAMGVLGLSVPERWGGSGLDALTTARVIEGLGRGCTDAGLVFSASAHLFAALMPIVEHGSDALRDALVPDLASGRKIAANAITEAEAGSDAFALRTRATRDGDHYVLDGVKSYVTNGPVADVFLTYATTDPSKGWMGVAAFAVDRESAGLTVGEPFAKLGLRSSPISSVYFDQVRVPADRLVGREAFGAGIFTASMQWERACLFAAWVGQMERQLEQVIAHVKGRKQFGKPLGKQQAVAHRVADMKLRLEAARLLLYRACWERDQGKPAILEVSLAKLAISEAAIQSALDAIQLHGGLGYVDEGGIEVALRDAIPTTIFSGTSEVQRDLVARRLGL